MASTDSPPPIVSTVFLVSHRLATIRRAGTIVVLEGGRVVDTGTHEVLATRSKTYREFLQTEARRAHLTREDGEA